MEVLIAPISGGYFCNQIAGGLILAEHGYSPQVIMGASGGAVAGVLLHGSDFVPRNIKYICGFCSSEMFAKEWLPFVPSPLIGFFRGSIYDHSGKHNEVFGKMFTKDTFLSREMWVLTYDIKKMEPTLFTNQSNMGVSLSCDIGVADDEVKINYMKGDILSYGDAILASASIPTVVPSVKINNSHHVDGGVYYASPLSPLSKSILKQDRFHLVYLHGKDIHNTIQGSIFDPNYTNIFETGAYAATSMIKSHISSDINVMLSMLERKAGNNTILMKDLSSSDDIQWYMREKKQWKASVLELTPENGNMLDIIDFCSEDLLESIEDVKSRITGRLHYLI